MSPPVPKRSRWSLRLVTIAGIEIRLHVTFLALVALIAVGSTSPEGPGPVAAVGWLAAVFTSVVLHELAHSFVARRHGIAIVEIELLPIGGVSKMAAAPEDPAVELRIAAAGPAASLAIAASIGLVAAAAGVALWPPGLYSGNVASRVLWLNLMLAAFNLLPALPLDGGRVLRAYLQMHLGRARATSVASAIARVLAGAMVLGGLLVNFWLAVIGAFVYLGARAEETSVLLHERLAGFRVRDVMISGPMVLWTQTCAGEVTARLWSSPQREFPVVDGGGRPVGLVTATALLAAPPSTTVGALMAPVQCVAPDSALEASGVLDSEVGAVVVSDGEHVVGLIRRADVLLLARSAPRPAPPAPTRW